MLLVTFASCEEDVKFNTPAVQGLKDNELWKATDYTATITGTSLTIEATNGFEALTLRTGQVIPGAYQLGVNETNTAAFVLSADGIEMNYTTGTNRGSGQIIISDDERETDLTRGFISGTFRFDALDDEGNVVNFQDGVFYKVPVTVIE